MSEEKLNEYLTLASETEKLPKVHPDFPALGGDLKTQAEDFVVDEELPYELSGEGEHLFIQVTKKNMTTLDLQQEISDRLNIPKISVGFAGLKDKVGVTTQWFSLPCPIKDDADAFMVRLGEGDHWQVKQYNRHINKLKTAHVKTNAFDIVLRNCNPISNETLQNIADKILNQGYLNAFGNQRFGRYKDNAHAGLQVILGKKRMRKGNKRQLLCNAFQSALFHVWIMKRHELGALNDILPGDVVQKVETNGMFEVEEENFANEKARFDAGELYLTGPIFGFKMRQGEGAGANIENEILTEFGINKQQLKQLRLTGTRRALLERPHTLKVELLDEHTQRWQFSLNSGTYATMLFSELGIKVKG